MTIKNIDISLDEDQDEDIFIYENVEENGLLILDKDKDIKVILSKVKVVDNKINNLIDVRNQVFIIV